ncbi:MAG: glycoside hydrolase family 95-like protein [Mobilitalea sp.]
MLVQSTDQRIILLPALPNEWKDGSIKGLCVRGGAEISLEWNDCQLIKCTINAKHRFQTDVIYKQKRIQISLEEGEVVLLSL